MILRRLSRRLSRRGPVALSECRFRHITPVSEPLVLISQVQRSGGTLMSQLFDGHPECHAHPKELTWGRPTKYDWPSPKNLLQGISKEVFHALDQTWIHSACRRGSYIKAETTNSNPEQYPFVFDRQLQLRIFNQYYPSEASTSMRALLDVYLTSFFNAWIDNQMLYGRKKCVTAFCPRILAQPGSMERFRKDYPDGHLVTIVREPVNWYTSALRHGYLERFGTTKAVMDLWVSSVDASLEALRQYPKQTTLIEFSSLLNDTSTVMRNLSSRIGINWSESLLNPTFNTIPIQSNSHFKPTKGIDSEVAKNEFRASLSKQEKSEVLDVAGKRYGEAAVVAASCIGPLISDYRGSNQNCISRSEI